MTTMDWSDPAAVKRYQRRTILKFIRLSPSLSDCCRQPRSWFIHGSIRYLSSNVSASASATVLCSGCRRYRMSPRRGSRHDSRHDRS